MPRRAPSSPDERLAQRVLEQGLVAPGQLADARSEQVTAAGRRPLAQVLVQRGLLEAGRLADLLRDGAGRTIGRYEVIREVARGGMGVVYEAVDPQLQRVVALKVLGAQGGAADVERLVREARLTAQLDHPHIIKVHEAGSAAGEHYIAMDFVAGGTLKDQLDALALDARVRLFEQVVAAVAHAHAQGVVHRDLKPANVLVGEDGNAVVTDFGLARSMDDDIRLTRSGAVIGTAAFMAPEQVEGQIDRLGPRTDVWALGVMLYELLTGALPFPGNSAAQVQHRILIDEPPHPDRVADVPRDLAAVCLKALQKRRGRRYADAGELAEELDRWRSGRPTRARPMGPARRLALWCRRHGRPVAAGALVVLSVVGSLAFALIRARSEAAAIRQAQAKTDAERRKTAEALVAEARQRAVAQQQRGAAQQATVRAERELSRARAHLSDALVFKADTALADGRVLEAAVYQAAARHTHDSPLARAAGLALPCPLARPRRLLPTTTPPATVALAPDASLVAAGVGRDVVLWRRDSGQRLRVLRGHEGPVLCVRISAGGDRLASAATDGTVRIWRLPDGTLQHTLGVLGRARTVAFSPDGRQLATGGADGVVRVWDLQRGTELKQNQCHAPRVMIRALAFSPDGRTIASGGGDRKVARWTLDRSAPPPAHDGHAFAVLDVAFSPDGRRIVSAGADDTVIVTDRAGAELMRLAGHRGDVASVVVGDRLIASASHDRTLRLWDTQTGELIQTLTGHTDALVGVARSGDGQWLATASRDGSVRVWQVRSGQAVRCRFPYDAMLCSLEVDPDGRHLTLGTFAGHLGRIDLRSGRTTVDQTRAHRGAVRSVARTMHDGQPLLASTGDDGRIRLWRPATLEPVAELPAGTKRVGSLAFSPDGRWLASGEANRAQLWDVRARRPVKAFATTASTLAFSPDGRWLATAGARAGVTIHRVPDGALVREIDAGNGLRALTFSPDGRVLASVGADHGIQLWDVASGERRRTLRGHTHLVFALRFSPDGRLLASVSADATARLWDPRSGQPLLVLADFAFEVLGVGFTPEGRLVCCSSDQSLRIYGLDTPPDLASAQRLAGLTLAGSTLVPMSATQLQEAVAAAVTPPPAWSERALDPCNRGSMRLEEKRPQGAEAYLRRALRIDPRHGRSWMLLGRALSMQGQHAEALAALARARPLVSEDERARVDELKATVRARQARGGR